MSFVENSYPRYAIRPPPPPTLETERKIATASIVVSALPGGCRILSSSWSALGAVLAQSVAGLLALALRVSR